MAWAASEGAAATTVRCSVSCTTSRSVCTRYSRPWQGSNPQSRPYDHLGKDAEAVRWPLSSGARDEWGPEGRGVCVNFAQRASVEHPRARDLSPPEHRMQQHGEQPRLEHSAAALEEGRAVLRWLGRHLPLRQGPSRRTERILGREARYLCARVLGNGTPQRSGEALERGVALERVYRETFARRDHAVVHCALSKVTPRQGYAHRRRRRCPRRRWSSRRCARRARTRRCRSHRASRRARSRR